MIESKYCPLRHQFCDGSLCAMWDEDANSCSVVSIAGGVAQLKQIVNEIYWLRRHMEENGARL